VWPVWWRLGVAAVCRVHEVMLVDACDGCGLPLRQGAAGQGGGVLQRRAADPLVCGNAARLREPGKQGRYGQRLDLLPVVPATAQVLDAQRVVLDVAFGGLARIAGMQVSGRDWFTGLRFTTGLHRLFASPEYVCGPGMPAAAADALLAVAGPGPPGRRPGGRS
jgi:hypothetical protein